MQAEGELTHSRKARRKSALALALLALVVAGIVSLVSGSSAKYASAAAPQPFSQANGPCAASLQFNQVDSPSKQSTGYATDYNQLYGIDVVSPTDVWAVGTANEGDVSGNYRTLIQHWNGTAWTIVPSPNSPGGGRSYLRSVSAVSASDIWAVGYADTGGATPIVLHYNGQTWSHVQLSGDTANVQLFGVVAIASNDVWAVGRKILEGNATRTYHWNGSTWTEDTSGRFGGNSEFSYYGYSFYAVSASTSNNVWAVGTALGSDNYLDTLIARYDGTRWTRVNSPNPGVDNTLRGVVAIAPNDVWAVGHYWNYDRQHTLTMRWNGASWSVVAAPDPEPYPDQAGAANPGAAREKSGVPQAPDGGVTPSNCPSGMCDGVFLFGVTAVSSGEVYAVGQYDTPYYETDTFAIRWNGSAWTQLPSANPSIFFNKFAAVAAAGPNSVWAVGALRPPNGDSSANGGNNTTLGGAVEPDIPEALTLIERYDTSVCPSPTPVTPVATSTPCAIGEASWDYIPGYDTSAQYHVLYDVGVVSPNDIWAVGSIYHLGVGGYVGLIEHWDGQRWNFVRHPLRGQSINGIEVISANDIWVVGPGDSYPLTGHWDGTSWRNVPNPAFGLGGLNAVSASGPNDVWAVGQYKDSGVLIMRWNGSSWSLADNAAANEQIQQAVGNTGSTGSTDAPNAPEAFPAKLTGVHAIAPNDVWAVGTTVFNGVNRTLAMHWDGFGWNVISTPSPGGYYNILFDVYGVASNDVWAVGYYSSAYSNPSQTLILHWDGTRWTRVSSPNPVPESGGGGISSEYVGNFLYSVVAASANEVWAVGKYNQGGYWVGRTLALRWNGSSWEQVESENPDRHNELRGVDVVGANYAWAVGFRDSLGNTLTERFGPPCSATGGPTAAPTNTATNTATPTACAVYNTTTGTGAAIVPGTTDTGNHCDNCTTSVELPFPYTYYGQTFTKVNVGDNGILQFSSTNGGHTQSCLPNPYVKDAIFALHYDLRTDGVGGVYTSVSGTAPNRVFNIEWRACVNMYDGEPCAAVDTNFQVRLYESGRKVDVIIGSVTQYSRYGIIGIQENTGARWTEYRCNIYNPATAGLRVTFDAPACGTGGSPVPATATNTVTGSAVATGTSETGVPTATNTAVIDSEATATVTAQSGFGANACNVSFADMPEGSTFGAYGECLACQQVLGGYACGGPGEPCNSGSDSYFRPANNVTRGQLAKIVASSSSLPMQDTEQMFQDVPPGSTFYTYANLMYEYGVLGGYPCGNVESEPCVAPDNLPYYRPGANATRGQISKILANASGMVAVPAGAEAHTFADVPPGSTYYGWVERLGRDGMMGGYACGSAGEPCDAQNRPYFRPNASATRGQLSKIVANTFFDECATR